ncbi:hypothetical protein GIB57_22305 [Pseudomonas tremae]|nr:hypothetical protein [Pseudomonas tremae]
MISSARLGDKHACPLPGHGTTPIASASGDVNCSGQLIPDTTLSFFSY